MTKNVIKSFVRFGLIIMLSMKMIYSFLLLVYSLIITDMKN